jgi:hypothetical protein
MQLRKHFIPVLFALGCAAACDVDTAPDGLRATPPGPGAQVIFEPTRRPIPEVPLPNDVATFPDPTSRTGRRVNVSLTGKSFMERNARVGFNEMEGWGTYMPIWVAFNRPEGTDPRVPAINLDAVKQRMPKGDYEFPDDPVYVVNLKTGVPVILDMGSGNFPSTLHQPFLYGENDPHAKESNLFFETREEGAGLAQGDYKPELDTDFDGVLDHPNTYGTASRPGWDDLLTWYERETDTIIMRPVIPMEEKTEYAVVLTDRLIGADNRPVRSPFPFIHHPSQRDPVGRLRDILNDGSRANYYGDIAGTGLDHVAFTWTFTTQPTQEDLLLIRDGLYGKGPFAHLAKEFPAKLNVPTAAGKVPAGMTPPPGWEQNPDCQKRLKTPSILNLNDPAVHDFLLDVLIRAAGEGEATRGFYTRVLESVSHVVVGTYDTPYFQGDPAAPDEDAHWHLDYKNGTGDIRHDQGHFWLWIPKPTDLAKPPYKTIVFGHGYSGSSADLYGLAGFIAQQGMAAIAIDYPQHRINLPPAQLKLISDILGTACLAPLAETILKGRAYDRDGDGTYDSGWWFWTPHLFRTRDNVRESIVDLLNISRIIGTFDGKTMSDQDYTGDGKPDLAGDFDGDGIPDVQSDKVSTMGLSLGGITTMISGAIDHKVDAAAPVVGGGGLTDIGPRSFGVSQSVVQKTLGPLVVSMPVIAGEPPSLGINDAPITPPSPYDDALYTDRDITACQPGQRSIRFHGVNGYRYAYAEIACLNPDELTPNMTVLVTNLATQETKCAGTGAEGRFRLGIASSKGDRIDIQVYATPHAVQSYKGCDLKPGAVAGRRVRTFEQSMEVYRRNADPTHQCPENVNGCAQFLDDLYPVGSPLVAVQTGLGLGRQSPDLRRFLALGQAVLDPGDPINYAAFFRRRQLYTPEGEPVGPKGLLNVPHIGDTFVNVSTGIAFGRAAGVIPFLPPGAEKRYPEYAAFVTPPEIYEEQGKKTPNQVLVDNWVAEGLSYLARTPAGPKCGPEGRKSGCPYLWKDRTCREVLFDPDFLSEGIMPWDQQHPAVPLRLARIAPAIATSQAGEDPTAEIERSFQPRIQAKPFGDRAWTGNDVLQAHLTYFTLPEGSHGGEGINIYCEKWTNFFYESAVIGRFLSTGGRDLYYLSHPKGHECLGDLSCDFIRFWKP